MAKNKVSALLFAFSLCTFPPAQAGDVEDKLIDDVIAAYGGQKAINNLNSILLHDRYKQLVHKRSFTPNTIEVRNRSIIVEIDYQTNNQRREHWETNHSGPYYVEQIHVGKKRYSSNHLQDTIAEAESDQPSTVTASNIRLLDTAIVKALVKNRGTAKYISEQLYLGRPHHVIETDTFGSRSPLSVYVDSETNLVSQMTRNSSAVGLLDYIYSDYKNKDGITYAADTTFVVGESIFSVTVDRDVDFNKTTAEAFALPSAYEKVELQNNSEMKIVLVAEGLYLVGQRGGFSAFLDTGDKLIAAGGYSNLTSRYDALVAHLGTEKPLSELIITHHHDDQVAGAKEALELGAKIVTVEAHKGSIEESLGRKLDDEETRIVQAKASLSNGAVQVFDIQTPHSEHLLLFYVPQLKAVFTSNHFYSPNQEKIPYATLNTIGLKRAILELGINVKLYIDGHNSRVFSASEFNLATKDYVERKCPLGERICS